MFEKSQFDTLLTPEEAAKKLNITLVKLHRYRKQGKIGYIKVDRRIKIRLTEVQRFLESGGQPNFDGRNSW